MLWYNTEESLLNLSSITAVSDRTAILKGTKVPMKLMPKGLNMPGLSPVNFPLTKHISYG